MIKPAAMRPETARLLGATLALKGGSSLAVAKMHVSFLLIDRPADVPIIATDNSVWCWPVDPELRAECRL